MLDTTMIVSSSKIGIGLKTLGFKYGCVIFAEVLAKALENRPEKGRQVATPSSVTVIVAFVCRYISSRRVSVGFLKHPQDVGTVLDLVFFLLLCFPHGN